MKCKKCNRQVTDDEIVTYTDGDYHKGCGGKIIEKEVYNSSCELPKII